MFQLSVKTKEAVGFETPDDMKVRAILADLSPQIATSYPLKIHFGLAILVMCSL